MTIELRQKILEVTTNERKRAFKGLCETRQCDNERKRFFEGKLQAIDSIALELIDILAYKQD